MCDPSRDLKKKNIQAQNRTTRDVLISEHERNNKDDFPHFKSKQLRSINFDLVQCDGLAFAKMHFISHEQRVHYIPLFIHLKTHDSRVMG